MAQDTRPRLAAAKEAPSSLNLMAGASRMHELGVTQC